MLEKLVLNNFRCFDNYEIEFNKFNVLVGKNNVGKSTVVDALKLISNVCRYAAYRIQYLEDRDIPFSLINLRYNYKEVDSVIHAKFSANVDIRVVFPLDGRPYFVVQEKGNRIVDRIALGRLLKLSLGIVPPVATFEENEKLTNSKYLRPVMVSHLTPRHFRNIWYYFGGDDFEEFREIIEKTWPGYTIDPPELDLSHNELYMFFKENNITREIFWAGHGFQIWLQLMTSLVKLGRVETLVLDEPDIYLHSDMQKRLVTLCKERANQAIIATHAVDIIEEVEPDDILCIDKDSDSSKRLSTIDEVQTILTELGSSQNLKLVHFYRGKTCLFVEGRDFYYLKALAKTLGIDEFVREEGFSVVPLDGFANWDRLTYINWVCRNALGEEIQCYVVLDNDYHTGVERKEIINSLTQQGVKVHIWERKEIENYAIEFDALYRMFTNQFQLRHGNATIPLSKMDFKNEVLSLFEELKSHVISQVTAREIESRAKRGIDPSTVISKVYAEFEKKWENIEFRRNVIPGKEFFSKLNAWLNKEYSIRIPISHAMYSLLKEESDPEVSEVINGLIRLAKSS